MDEVLVKMMILKTPSNCDIINNLHNDTFFHETVFTKIKIYFTHINHKRPSRHNSILVHITKLWMAISVC